MQQTLLPADRLEQVDSWGGANQSVSYVFRPSTVDDLREVFRIARETGRTVGLRGGGNSYGDAAMNSENILIDMRRMARVLDWQPDQGIIQVEPAVTLRQVWEYVLEDGWWPPIATGTMKTTMGGCAAMNTHGKNAWNMGVFGDHVLSFELLLPSGEVLTCSREQNRDLFLAAIGGFGMLGVFVSLTLKMKRVYSGLLNVDGLIKPNLRQTMAYFDDHLHDSDYLVAWLDAFATGKDLGRSEIHRGTYLSPGEDPQPSQTMRLSNQHLPENIMGLVPRSILWQFQRPFWNQYGMRLVNFAKFGAAWLNDGKRYQQPHALFHFLLDYFDWRKPFGAGGLIQYQPFIPKENAEWAFYRLLSLQQRYGDVNLLTVMKRHKPDNFLMSYAVDGYSLAMDLRITDKNRQKIVRLTREMDEIVLEANGRFYFAKDSTVRPAIAERYLGAETIAKFKELKQRCDPQNMLETNLWRRVFAHI